MTWMSDPGMQVSNNALIYRPNPQQVRQIQESDERLPERQRPSATPPVERVIQGELVSETDLSPARVSAAHERTLQNQASAFRQGSTNQAAIQSYLDVEVGTANSRVGLDLFV